MQILLINDNSSVSKLINLTAKKYDYEIEEVNDITELKDGYKDIIFVDDAISDDIDTNFLVEKTGCSELVYIASKGSQTPQEYKYTLTKPFLPSDFQNIVETIVGISKTMDEDTNIEEITQEIEDHTDDDEDDFLLDELEMDKIKDETSKDKDIDNEDNEELSLDEDLFMDDEDSIKEISEDDISKNSNDESTVILDKEDIEEVKELLNENEDKDIDNELQMTENDENDIDDFSFEEDKDDEELPELSFDDIAQNLEFDENQKDEDIVPSEITFDKEEEDIVSNEDKNKEETIVDIEQNKVKNETQESNLNDKLSSKSPEELDLIDEQSLKELFGQNSGNEQMEEKKNNEEDMEIESFEEIKPKKKKKKKKLKKEELSSLQEEITSKLLDIDTLREVLDGMEIRIKFYNKNKK